MSAKPGAANKKVLIIMSVVGLLVMATVAWVLTRTAKTNMVTELYKYYPENTAFFMEVEPGEKLASRFFTSLDKMRAMSANKTAQAGHNDIKLASLFEKDFEPQFSAGTWVAGNKGQNASEPAQAGAARQDNPFLVVVPTKKGVTMETLAKDLKVDMANFEQKKQDDATLLVSKNQQHPPLALHDGHLLIADSEATITSALGEYKTDETLLDNPLYKENLALLPAEREGTVLTLNGEIQQLSENDVKDPTMQNVVQLQKEMQAATPVMVGSIEIDKDQYIKFNSFTPVNLSKIQKEGFRKDVKDLFAKQATFTLPNILPENTVVYGGMVGLGQYYDMYVNHIANAEGKQAISNFEKQMQMMGLDLRKNLVSLLDGKAAVGIMANAGNPEMLFFLNYTPDTEKTLSQFGMMAAQMTGGKVADKKVDEQHTIKVIESPAMPIRVAYSNVQADTVVLGTQAGVENVYAVEQNKQPALDENKLYKELAGELPSKVSGVFFVDLAKGAALIDDLSRRAPRGANAAQQANMKELLSGFEGIAGSNSMEGEKMLKGHLTIKLAADH